MFTALSSPIGGTTSATINTFTSVLGQNSGRKGCIIQNTSANPEFIYEGPIANATTAMSLSIAAGASFNCTSPGGLVSADQISIASGTASSTYAGFAQ